MPVKRNIPRVCRTCGADFMTWSRRVKHGGGLYCRPSHQPRGGQGTKRSDVEICDDGTARIPLRALDRRTVLAYAIIDAADVDWAIQWRWSFANGYATRREKINGRRVGLPLHRELLGLVYGDQRQGDHINRNPLDDRRSNLRIVPRGSQPHNSSSQVGSTSPYRGVSWHSRRRRWGAVVTTKGKAHFLGYFTDEQEAAEAASAARLRLLPYAVD